ncbi:MAG TPA: hypothetical protein VFK03_02560, partial [Candidatus Saccharimonadales bacterium]|nr:hypothetical protein [Candidatus Saccharimonadales bacterium]
MSSPIFVIKGFDLAASLTEEGQAAYMPDVEALRGANSLETVTTAGLGLKTLSLFVINGQIDFFVLTTGSADANDPDNQVQPLDHDNTTNNVYWQRSGGFTTGLLGAQVTRAAAQNLASGVETAISFDTIRSNTGEFDNAVPTRFTCIKPGTYVFHGSLAYAANSSGMRSAFLKKNGSAYIAAETRPANASGSTVIPVTAFVTLAVGDYVVLVGLQTSAGNLDVQKL